MKTKLIYLRRKQLREISYFLISIFFGLICSTASAIQPTQDQLEAFKRMSPFEQQQLASQFGIDVSAITQDGNSESVIQPGTSVLPRPLKNTPTDPDQTLDEAIEEKSNEEELEEEGLEPFGYDLFAGDPTTFAPITDIPVSSDYILGPGDALKVNLYGKENQFYELSIDQEGSVYLPDLGPLSLTGLNFSEAKKRIADTIDQKMIGVTAIVSMGQLRSIRVFVLGEAYLPGSYVVSSLSTITNALLLGGGVSLSGSLRNIQLKRKGELIQSFDLYDLLLNGDTTNDAQLKSGDVVFIPPVGATASIEGEVRRPAIYELKGGETLGNLVDLAGGLLSTAHPSLTNVTRNGDKDERLLLDVDLSNQDHAFMVLNGDSVNVPASLGILNNIVTVSGQVFRPGVQSRHKGMRISDVVSLAGIKPETDLNYALIKRYLKPNGKLQVLSFSLKDVLADIGSQADLIVEPLDELMFFSLFNSDDSLLENINGNSISAKLVEDELIGPTREAVILALIEEVRAHADIFSPSQEVSISGNVRYPGTYPLVEGMDIEVLLMAAGGLTEKAFKLRAELSRTELNAEQERIQTRLNFNLDQPVSLDYQLKSRDVLQIKTIPNWAESEQVVLEGEVKFPGIYPFYKDDTLASVIERAGGLTKYAYAPGAVFTRLELKEQQAEQLEELEQRLVEDIAKAELVAKSQNVDKADVGDIGEAQKLLAQLRRTPAMGRLVIDLQKVLEKDEKYNIPLQNGDELVIPSKKNSVTIIGEVQLPISQIYETEVSYLQYIDRSGGTTDNADEDRIYIIKANGAVQIPQSSNWLASANTQIAPGDTIVVPLDADKVDQVVLWRDMSQIFYQIALGAAAVGSL